MNENPYYPPKQKTGNLDDEWRQLYNHVYSSQKRLENLETQLSFLQKRHEKVSDKVAAMSQGGASATKIAGLNVKAIQPQSGNAVTNLAGVPTLGYNSTTGQIEWYIPSS